LTLRFPTSHACRQVRNNNQLFKVCHSQSLSRVIGTPSLMTIRKLLLLIHSNIQKHCLIFLINAIYNVAIGRQIHQTPHLWCYFTFCRNTPALRTELHAPAPLAPLIWAYSQNSTKGAVSISIVRRAM
jgi:hypothetical protein